MRVTVLMPNAPPLVCGVADHSLLMGSALARLGCEVDYLACRSDGSRMEHPDMHTWDGSAGGLAGAIRRAGTQVLWLQYSGYGYSRKGVPFRLARALGQLRKGRHAPRIAVCMHETHADLSRLGWHAALLQRLQIAAARRVARAGDVVFATVDVNLQRCVNEYGVAPERISLLPIATNIPRVTLDEGDRAAFRKRLGLAAGARIAAVFGLWATQSRALALFEDDLASALRGGRIDHVIAIGGETAAPPGGPLTSGAPSLNGQLTVLGPAPEQEVARILRCCDVGLVPTPLDYVRKSGVAAAFTTAELDIWMKNGRSELIIDREPEPFPEWADLAASAMERIGPERKRHEHDRR